MKSVRKLEWLVLAGGLAMMCAGGTGCATAQAGAHQDVSVSTTPSGATVEVSGQRYETPCEIPLARSSNHRLVISKSGYETVERIIVRKPTNRTNGNIFIGGLIGFLVDAITGANNDLEPATLDVRLSPLPESVAMARE